MTERSTALPVTVKKPAPPSAWPIFLVRKLLLTTEGRDKVMKIIQYLCKNLAWALMQMNYQRPPSMQSGLSAKLSVDKFKSGPWLEKSRLLASHLSLTRKILRIAHALDGAQELAEMWSDGLPILQGGSPPFASLSLVSYEFHHRLCGYLEPLNACIGVINDIADDIICISKMKMLSSTWAKRFTPLSDRCWLLSIWIDVYANLVRQWKCRSSIKFCTNDEESDVDSKKKIELVHKLSMEKLSFVKLMADYVFCAIDVHGLSVSETWQNAAGLIAAILSTIKLYVKSMPNSA